MWGKVIVTRCSGHGSLRYLQSFDAHILYSGHMLANSGNIALLYQIVYGYYRGIKQNKYQFYNYAHILQVGQLHLTWASFQICKLAGCSYSRNAGNVFLTNLKGNRQSAIPACIAHVLHAQVLVHVGIVNPRWRGKRYRHSRCLQFYILARGPLRLHFTSVAMIITDVNM